MVQATCPDASRWEALLADTTSPGEATELESHLSSCSDCRTLLDDLAVGSSAWLRDASRLATPVGSDPALTRTLHRLHDSAVDDEHTIPPIPLDFLSPSDQPGILGTLGRYQVLAVLGRGAFGIVLKALDPDLLRPVAIKVLAPYLASSGTARQRFIREGRAAAAVSHDHVIKIHSIEPSALPYLVMEYVTGVSLQVRLDRDGPLPPNEIARIGLQAARGLEAAHAQGLVHRDIKPANILLENGVERVKLTDFGLARAADDARLTQSGVAAGTPLYMSPEQARGDSVDNRSDLFSLGSVLYALATGFPPFRAGSTMGVLNRITNDPPRPIRETIPDFPVALEKIIMQLLEKDPSRRFHLAADVSFKLTAFLAGPPQEPATSADEADEAEPEHAEPTKWWVVALCLLAAAAMVAIVLTFKTSKGTLVVEIDDPEVKVALDGEELTITGAGPQEVRLKPGKYDFVATKGGKVVKQEIVTITKNGKQVVKVIMEPPSPLPAPVPYAGKDAKKDGPYADLLDERLANVLPDANAEALELMRQAYRDQKSKVAPVRIAGDGPVVSTHSEYPQLQRLMARAAEPTIEGSRLVDSLKAAYDLTNEIWRQTEYAYSSAWHQKFSELEDRYVKQRRRIPENAAGRVINHAPIPADPDSATADLTEPDRGRAKRFLSLRDEFTRRHPETRNMADRFGRAKHELTVRVQQQRSATVSEKDVAAAQEKVRTAEAKLKAEHDAISAILTDMDKVLIEMGAKPEGGTASKSKDVIPPDKRNESPEDRQKRLINEYQALVGRLAKTEAGRVLLIAGPKADLDKLMVGLSAEETIRAKRLLVLRDQFGVLVPAAQKELDRWEKASLTFQDREIKYQAGTISENEFNAAKLEVRQAERALKNAEDGMAGVIADVKKLADELRAPAADAPDPVEGEFKKVMAEFDAITVRLAKTSVGRLLATIPYQTAWGEAELQLAFASSEKAKIDQGRRLLTYRDQVMAQAVRATSAFSQRTYQKEQRLTKKKEDQIPNIDDEIRKCEHDIRFRTATIRGIIDDLKKLADEIDPPDKKNIDPLVPPVDPKVQLQTLRDQLKALEKAEKDYSDLSKRRNDQAAEIQTMEADLVTSPNSKELTAKIDAAKKSLQKTKDDLDTVKSELARYGNKADLQKEIDRLQKAIEAKKSEQ